MTISNKTAMILSASAVLFAFVAFAGPMAVTAHHDDEGPADACGQEFTYVKSSDFSDSRVSINFMFGDLVVSVDPNSGYKLVSIDYDYTGSDSNDASVSVGDGVGTITVDAPGFSDIEHVTVKLKKTCPDVCGNLEGDQYTVPEGLVLDEGGMCVPPPPVQATIVASKIICPLESQLPNWGAGAPDITASTASDFLAAHVDCSAAPDWQFQWALGTELNPGDSAAGGDGWTAFTGSVQIDPTDQVWVREVPQNGYVPFGGANTTASTSAELYCNSDVLNYDNFDFIAPVSAGSTYYCVAFNAPVAVTPPPVVCELPQVLNEAQDGCVNPPLNCESPQVPNQDATACVDPSTENTPSITSSTNPECSDGIDNDNDGRVDYPGDNSCSDGSDNTEGNDGGGGFAGSWGGGGGGGNGGLVLGASTDAPSCSDPLLTSYMRKGKNNDPEQVKKLQNFLNTQINAGLEVNGIFDQATEDAVKSFQLQYWLEVLAPWKPWGLDDHTPTGYVYKTTLRWINLLSCSSLNIPLPALP